MRQFTSAGYAQHFLAVYDAMLNLFRLGHPLRATHYPLSLSATPPFGVWRQVGCVQVDRPGRWLIARRAGPRDINRTATFRQPA